MKTSAVCLFFLFTNLQFVFAQNKFYDFTFFIGMSPQQSPVQAGRIVNRENILKEFVFNLDNVEKQFTLGFKKNFRFSRPFFGTLGLEYCRQRQNYSMLFTHAELPGGKEYGLRSTRQVISLPAGVGVKFKGLDITSGLQVQYGFKSEIEEEIPMGIVMAKSGLEVGWYSGMGFSYDRTRIGIQYQSTLHRYGHNLMYQQKPMELMNVPGNLSITLGYSF